MFDSIDAASLPVGAPLYAGYVGGLWPSYAAIRERFPLAEVVSIAVNDSEVAQVLDVEAGDATPAQAPGWCARMRAQGITPTVYMNRSTWPAVKGEFSAHNLPKPSYWVADYSDPTWPEGAVAFQHASNNDYDTSSVLDFWPGVDQEVTDVTVDELNQALAAACSEPDGAIAKLMSAFYNNQYGPRITGIEGELAAIKAKLGA